MITNTANVLLKTAEYSLADWARDERKRHDDTYYDDRGRLIAGSLGLTAGTLAAGLGRHAYAKHLGWGDRTALHSALFAGAGGGVSGEAAARYLYNKLMEIDLSDQANNKKAKKNDN